MVKNIQERKKKGKIILFVGAVLLTTILLFEGFYNYSLGTRPSIDETVFSFVINNGESLEDAAKRLKNEGFIRSKYFFLTYLSRENLDSKVQAGKHSLSKNMTIREISDALMKSEDDYVDLTILEGWNNKEIISYLGKKGVDTDQLVECLKECEFAYGFIDEKVKNSIYEGFLFPDTYRVTPDLDPEKILNKMLKNFDDKLKNVLSELPEENDVYDFAKKKSLYEHVIVASMIEREVRGIEDMKIVSGIIWKRLKQNMGLGIDATLLYALGDWKAEITIEDLSLDSPYNTRKKLGLPPTPISSPSYSALLAAFYPSDSEYLYYLTSKTGEVIYGKTLEEHNRNKREYLN